MKKFILALMVLFVAGCDYTPDERAQMDQRDKSHSINLTNSDRITVTRLSVIDDNLAYLGKRATYSIKDTETGKEFIGVSGIGIVETSSHQSGKVRVEHEE